MVVSVQFHNKEEVFRGRIYDFCMTCTPPKVGDIIRMIDLEDNPICNGTRVKVRDVRDDDSTELKEIKYVKVDKN